MLKNKTLKYIGENIYKYCPDHAMIAVFLFKEEHLGSHSKTSLSTETSKI